MSVHIGDRGCTVTSLRPQGTVRVGDKELPARTENELVGADCEVIIIGGNHHGLIVRKLEPGRPFPILAKLGEVISMSFSEQVTGEGRRIDAQRQRDNDARRARSRKWGAVLGAISAVGGIWYCWSEGMLNSLDLSQWILLFGLCMLPGVLWGTVVSWLISEKLTSLDLDSFVMTVLTTMVALLGGTTGVIIGYESSGILEGIGLGIGATIAFGLIVPGLTLIKDWIGI